MTDFLKKYKKNKLMSNVNIVLASLVLAFGINFILIDGTDIGQSLKTSVLNSEIQNQKSDISIENISGELFLVANKNINDVESISFSLTYNPTNISKIDIKSEYGDVLNLSNTAGINSVIITTENTTNIKNGDRIVKIIAEKTEKKTENLNIINANFKDSNGEQFIFSTSGVTF